MNVDIYLIEGECPNCGYPYAEEIPMKPAQCIKCGKDACERCLYEDYRCDDCHDQGDN